MNLILNKVDFTIETEHDLLKQKIKIEGCIKNKNKDINVDFIQTLNDLKKAIFNKENHFDLDENLCIETNVYIDNSNLKKHYSQSKVEVQKQTDVELNESSIIPLNKINDVLNFLNLKSKELLDKHYAILIHNDWDYELKRIEELDLLKESKIEKQISDKIKSENESFKALKIKT